MLEMSVEALFKPEAHDSLFLGKPSFFGRITAPLGSQLDRFIWYVPWSDGGSFLSAEAERAGWEFGRLEKLHIIESERSNQALLSSELMTQLHSFIPLSERALVGFHVSKEKDRIRIMEVVSSLMAAERSIVRQGAGVGRLDRSIRQLVDEVSDVAFFVSEWEGVEILATSEEWLRSMEQVAAGMKCCEVRRKATMEVLDRWFGSSGRS